MLKTKRDDPAELLRLAITGLDEQIAELQETRTQLAALIDQRSAGLAAETAAPRKRRKLSAEAGRPLLKGRDLQRKRVNLSRPLPRRRPRR